LSYASVPGERIYSFQNLNSIYIFTFIHFSRVANDSAPYQKLIDLTTFGQMHYHDIFQRYTQPSYKSNAQTLYMVSKEKAS